MTSARVHEDAPRLEDMPTVLDSEQARAVLRIGRDKFNQLLASGRLRRLAYSRTTLIDSREIRRFLADETERGES